MVSNQRDVLLSIRLMTYNHESFIRCAMDSIMMQVVDFPVEVVVGDDFSTDRTLEVIRTYKDTEYIHIRILNRSIGGTYWKKRQEIGRLYNFVDILNNCKGKYIALLDGDDYWIDQTKLQKQVDFLEGHENHILVAGGYQSKDSEYTKNIVKKNIVNPIYEDDFGYTFTMQDIRKAWLTKNVTAVFRNEKEIFSLLLNYKYANHGVDVFLYYHLLKKGKGYYFKRIFGVYNIHENGIFSLKSDVTKLLNHYNMYKELYTATRDGYPRYMYLKQCCKILRYKQYKLIKDRKTSFLSMIKEALLLIRTRMDIIMLMKSLLPKNFKN